MLAAKLLGGIGEEKIFSDDVFSAYTYTGNGATQTITNGIDLAGKGGMVWVKSRDAATEHSLVDTARGASNNLTSNGTYAQGNYATVTGFNSDGFNLGSQTVSNASTVTFVSHTFRQAPKFFDVVTYTGDDGTNHRIPHSLGTTPGLIICKVTNAVGNWWVYHRSLANTEYLALNTTAAKDTYSNFWGSSAPTSTDFGVGANQNYAGQTYVAYLFAHDTSTDGIVQCGTFASPASAPPTATTVTLGWEPQYVLCKSWDTAGDNWKIYDSSRNMSLTGLGSLSANTSAAESMRTVGSVVPTATGFNILADDQFGRSQNFIYLAIRRPNKPPTVGTQVYDSKLYTGAGTSPVTVSGISLVPDLVSNFARSSLQGAIWFDRLRGGSVNLEPRSTGAENANTSATATFDKMTTVTLTGGDVNSSGVSFINHFFKRAPGVFDVVCYTGTGVAGVGTSFSHNLGAVPELIVVKNRGASADWYVYNQTILATHGLQLNTNTEKFAVDMWGNTAPTSSVFNVAGNYPFTNGTGQTYVAYLFATKAGISKVGSYTGTATAKQVDCGFTTGARFVLIKRTDSTGNWYVWDTVRGIIAGNDPYLLLNSTAAEVTGTDYIDPYTSGFELSSTAPAAINASGGTYIYLAFA